MDCLASVRTSAHLIEIEILALLNDTSYHAILGIRDNYAQNAIYIHFGTKNAKMHIVSGAILRDNYARMEVQDHFGTLKIAL